MMSLLVACVKFLSAKISPFNSRTYESLSYTSLTPETCARRPTCVQDKPFLRALSPITPIEVCVRIMCVFIQPSNYHNHAFP